MVFTATSVRTAQPDLSARWNEGGENYLLQCPDFEPNVLFLRYKPFWRLIMLALLWSSKTIVPLHDNLKV